MAASDKMIQKEFYGAIVACLPIACVDVIIKRDGEYFLVRRRNEPLRGYLWVPGGRILKDESAIQAAHRKVKEETGLSIKTPKFIGYYEDFFEVSAFGVPTHTISIVFEADADGEEDLNKSEVVDAKWADYLPQRLMERLVRVDSACAA